MTRRRYRSDDPFEDLLDGCASDDSALFELLTAARASGTRDEMVGLPAARAAFVRVREPHQRTSARRLPAATRTAARRLVALKAMAAVSGATMIGGVAYAATEVNLLGGSPDHHSHSTAPSGPAGPRQGATGAGGQNPGGAQYPAGSISSTDLGSSAGLGLPSGANPPEQDHPPQGNGPHPPHSTGPAQPHPTASHPSHPTASHPSHPSHPSHTGDPDAGDSPGAQRNLPPTPSPSGAEQP